MGEFLTRICRHITILREQHWVVPRYRSCQKALYVIRLRHYGTRLYNMFKSRAGLTKNRIWYTWTTDSTCKSAFRKTWNTVAWYPFKSLKEEPRRCPQQKASRNYSRSALRSIYKDNLALTQEATELCIICLFTLALHCLSFRAWCKPDAFPKLGLHGHPSLCLA